MYTEPSSTEEGSVNFRVKLFHSLEIKHYAPKGDLDQYLHSLTGVTQEGAEPSHACNSDSGTASNTLVEQLEY
jgi:hypothetical protein